MFSYAYICLRVSLHCHICLYLYYIYIDTCIYACIYGFNEDRIQNILHLCYLFDFWRRLQVKQVLFSLMELPNLRAISWGWQFQWDIRRTSKFLVGHTDTVLTVAMKGNIDAWLFCWRCWGEVTWKPEGDDDVLFFVIRWILAFYHDNCFQPP